MRKIANILLLLLLALSTNLQAQDNTYGNSMTRGTAGVGWIPNFQNYRQEAEYYFQSTPTQVSQIRIGYQYGLGYLPLLVMRQYRLIEKHASAFGLGDVRVVWTKFPSGDASFSAMQSGFLDFAAGGVTPLLKQWDQTNTPDQPVDGIKGVAALSEMPLLLNAVDPSIKSIKDFKPGQKIALPSKKDSQQAIVLRMAAAKAFGDENYRQLDDLMVDMSHPAGMRALLAMPNEIDAQFTSAPYQYQELARKGVRTVLNSEDVVGSNSTFTVLWGSGLFVDKNSRTTAAVVAALYEAMEIIHKRPKDAAQTYMVQVKTPLDEEQLTRIISRPEVHYELTPKNVMQYARFMHKTGQIKQLPSSWKELFFPMVHDAKGS